MELNRNLLSKAFMAIMNFEGYVLFENEKIINLSDAATRNNIGVNMDGMDCNMVLYLLYNGLKEGWITITADESNQEEIQYFNKILDDFQNYNESYHIKD